MTTVMSIQTVHHYQVYSLIPEVFPAAVGPEHKAAIAISMHAKENLQSSIPPQKRHLMQSIYPRPIR
jgi:hypothetical protein